MRGLHRQRGDAGAADRGQEGVDLRLGRLLGAGGAVRDARAGAHQLDRLHRLDQEIGDPHLHQRARDARRRRLCVTATTGGQAPTRAISRCQRRHLVGAAGVEIDHHDGRVLQRRAHRPCSAMRAGDHLELDRARWRRRSARTARSNSASAVSTTTRGPVRIRRCGRFASTSRCALLGYFTGAAGCVAGRADAASCWLGAPRGAASRPPRCRCLAGGMMRLVR